MTSLKPTKIPEESRSHSWNMDPTEMQPQGTEPGSESAQNECRLREGGWGMRHPNTAQVMPKGTLHRAAEEEEGAEISTWGRSWWPGGQLASFVPEQTPTDYPSSPWSIRSAALSLSLSFLHKSSPLLLWKQMFKINQRRGEKKENSTCEFRRGERKERERLEPQDSLE